MATILTKRSNTASSVPVAGDLTNSTGGAELAVNTADKRLFTKDSGGTVVELGTNPSSITLASGTANAVPYLNGSKVLTSGSALTFDGTNLGLGVTPSAWSVFKAFDLVGNGAIASVSDNLNVIQNAYYNGSNYIYKANAYAARYTQSTGQHLWYTAPSGTAGNAISFTQAMSLLSSGELLIGKTSTSSSASGLVLQNYLGVAGGVSCVKTATGQYTAWGNFYSGTYVGGMEYTNIATIFATSSDYRLKNITGSLINSGAYIDSLNPVEGTWKSDGSVFVGLIAHEAQEVSRTQVATGVKDGEKMQAMDYSSPEIIANMIAELKSLRKRVAKLESA